MPVNGAVTLTVCVVVDAADGELDRVLAGRGEGVLDARAAAGLAVAEVPRVGGAGGRVALGAGQRRREGRGAGRGRGGDLRVLARDLQRRPRPVRVDRRQVERHARARAPRSAMAHGPGRGRAWRSTSRRCSPSRSSPASRRAPCRRRGRCAGSSRRCRAGRRRTRSSARCCRPRRSPRRAARAVRPPASCSARSGSRRASCRPVRRGPDRRQRVLGDAVGGDAVDLRVIEPAELPLVPGDVVRRVAGDIAHHVPLAHVDERAARSPRCSPR